MTTTTEATVATTQVYKVFIRATPQAIWDAITRPEWTEQYGYGGRVDYQLRPGGAYRHGTSPEMRALGAPELACDGEVVEADPPRRLIQTWRLAMDPESSAEGAKRLTWEIKEVGEGVASLTVIHELGGAPKTAAMVSGTAEGAAGGGGWSWILSDLKSLLETGKTMAG